MTDTSCLTSLSIHPDLRQLVIKNFIFSQCMCGKGRGGWWMAVVKYRRWVCFCVWWLLFKL